MNFYTPPPPPPSNNTSVAPATHRGANYNNLPQHVLAAALTALDQPPAPSLREILGAYRLKGDGDREMLLAILHAKTAEDQRIAETAKLHQTILQLSSFPPDGLPPGAGHGRPAVQYPPSSRASTNRPYDDYEVSTHPSPNSNSYDSPRLRPTRTTNTTASQAHSPRPSYREKIYQQQDQDELPSHNHGSLPSLNNNKQNRGSAKQHPTQSTSSVSSPNSSGSSGDIDNYNPTNNQMRPMSIGTLLSAEPRGTKRTHSSRVELHMDVDADEEHKEELRRFYEQRERRPSYDASATHGHSSRRLSLERNSS